jgi:anti-sigma factor RsiW
MSSCDETQVAIERQLAGALPASERPAIDEHLAGCNECVQYREEARASTGALRAVSAQAAALGALDVSLRLRQAEARPARGGEVLGLLGVLGFVVLLWLSGYAHVGTVLVVGAVAVGGAELLRRRRERHELDRLVELATSTQELLFAHRSNLARQLKEQHDAASLSLGGGAVLAVLAATGPGELFFRAGLLVLAATMLGQALYVRRRVEPRLRAELDDLGRAPS